ncbi:hypothetical protein PRZ48_010333 [Zasmidium cellare]|uniref:Uncharacterized protein n=1 Tax=Zasmidium cellare TaxID=395010 RepID=A0ABR0E8X3_ZASCE|nr:hypothetical protein PRZ48_010333 [Zasmidium cellare]
MVDPAKNPMPSASRHPTTHNRATSTSNPAMMSQGHLPQLPAQATYNATEEANTANTSTPGADTGRNDIRSTAGNIVIAAHGGIYINDHTSITADCGLRSDIHHKIQRELDEIKAMKQELSQCLESARADMNEVSSLKAELRSTLSTIQSHQNSVLHPTDTYIIPARRFPATIPPVAAPSNGNAPAGPSNNAPTTAASSAPDMSAHVTVNDLNYFIGEIVKQFNNERIAVSAVFDTIVSGDTNGVSNEVATYKRRIKKKKEEKKEDEVENKEGKEKEAEDEADDGEGGVSTEPTS